MMYMFLTLCLDTLDFFFMFSTSINKLKGIAILFFFLISISNLNVTAKILFSFN